MVHMLSAKDADLMRAVLAGDLAATEAALKGGIFSRGADVNCRDQFGNTPLMQVTDNLAMMDLLARKGADFKATNRFGQTALHKAADHGHRDAVLWLLEMGLDLEQRDAVGCTPFLQAASHLAMLQLLAERGANVKTADQGGSTALHKAALYGHAETIRWLISQGLDVNVKSRTQETPLMSAVAGENPAILELLLELGADIDACDKEGNTALASAASAGKTDLVLFLLDHGAAINPEDPRRRTPLQNAVMFGHAATARVLIDRGAHLSVKLFGSQKSLLELAVEENSPRLVRMLRENCCPPSLALLKQVQGNAALVKALGSPVVVQPDGVDLVCRKCGRKYRLGRNAIVMTMAEVMESIQRRGGAVIGAEATASHPDMVGDCPWDILSEEDKKLQRTLTLEVQQGRRGREWTCQKCQETQPYPEVHA